MASPLPQLGASQAAAECTNGYLAAVAVLRLNNGLAQGALCGVVGGLDVRSLQKSPKLTCRLLELLAGAQHTEPR